MKAFSYLRVSGKGQIGGDGFPRQRRAVQDYAKRNGLQIVEEFRDEGVSGSRELDCRVGLATLLDRAASNGVVVVLIENAARLARDLMVQEVVLGEFRKLGTQVTAADSGTELTVDDDDPTRKLIRQVLGAVAEFEKSTLVLKLRAARERKRSRTGRCEGRKPYGERPGEMIGLKRIRQLSRKPRGKPRRSLQEIADTLAAEGITTRSGGQWTRQAVHVIRKRLTSGGHRSDP